MPLPLDQRLVPSCTTCGAQPPRFFAYDLRTDDRYCFFCFRMREPTFRPGHRLYPITPPNLMWWPMVHPAMTAQERHEWAELWRKAS